MEFCFFLSGYIHPEGLFNKIENHAFHPKWNAKSSRRSIYFNSEEDQSQGAKRKLYNIPRSELAGYSLDFQSMIACYK